MDKITLIGVLVIGGVFLILDIANRIDIQRAWKELEKLEREFKNA